MNSSDKLKQLLKLLTEFEELDISIPSALSNKDIGVLDRTLAKKKEMKRLLSECDPLSVDRGIGNKLKKIRDNHGHNIDRVLETFKEVMGEAISQESEEGIDIVDALFSEGTADYVDEGFFTRRNEVSTLILSESINSGLPHILRHFRNLRECYSLGLFETAVIYCRALIETGCFEALRRQGLIRRDLKVEDFREYHLKALMESIRGIVSRGNWNRADKVIKNADRILHSKRESPFVNQNEAYDAIKDTFAIIEELYSGQRRRTIR